MIELKIEEFLFQSYTLSFAIPLNDPKVADLVEDAPLELDGETFFITLVEDDRAETGIPVKRVEAEARWMRLTDILRPGDLVLSKVSVEQGLRIILAGTGWSVDQFTEDSTLYSLEATDASVLDLLWQWARVTKNEIYFHKDNKQINFIPQIGADTNLSFRYSRNLRSIKRTVVPPVATRVYPYGKDDLSVTGHTPSGRDYIEDYSFYTSQGITIEQAEADYRKDVMLSDSSFVESSGLYAWAQSQLALLSQPKVVYSATVADLSRITKSSEAAYACGDIVHVSDPLLGLDLPARVTRRVIYPHQPEQNVVELSFSTVDIPNPNVKSSRNQTGRTWELFESRNWESFRRAQQINTILARMFLRTQENSEWVVHYQVQGVAEGDSTVTFEFVDTNNGDKELWPPYTVTLTDGEPFNFTMSYGEKEIPAGEYELTVRAISDTTGAGVYIPELQTALWVLARGVTRSQKTYPNSVRYDHTGSVQQFEVPEFVQEIRVQCVAGGQEVTALQGSSGSVTASIHVTEFEIFDVYVGGKGRNGSTGGATGGWPDGGNGGRSVGVAQPRNNTGGSGSSSIRRIGTSFSDSLIVAPGGGGRAEAIYAGGDAGFYGGQTGAESAPNQAGKGATQFAGGAGGQDGDDQNGQDGSFGQGGNGYQGTSIFSFYGGGGGGGWFGGGGGCGPLGLSSADTGRAGGGGSGWVGDVFDVEIEDGFMTGDEHGYIIISWPDPDPSLAEYS